VIGRDGARPDEEAPDEEAPEGDRPPAAGPLASVGAAVVVVAVGVAGLLGSWALGLGIPRSPGPGTWPFLVSAAMVVLGVLLGIGSGRTTDAERFARSSWPVLAGLATMLVFVALIGVIGFEIPSALLAFVWLRFLGGEGWRTSILTSLGIVVAFYLIFVGALAVPIPHMF
jgi:putative tricarboxylic transport membrane protein